MFIDYFKGNYTKLKTFLNIIIANLFLIQNNSLLYTKVTWNVSDIGTRWRTKSEVDSFVCKGNLFCQ